MPIVAKLVYDGGSEVYVPSEMGIPRSDQLQGTPAEILCELAGRVCYDSLGKGRSSEDYHKHILEVNHTSTLEHFNFTVQFSRIDEERVALACLNRKGVHFQSNPLNISQVTANLRSILEWDKYTNESNSYLQYEDVCDTMKVYGNMIAPNIIPILCERIEDGCSLKSDTNSNQSFISMFLSGSRGFSHEQVRHRYAMSQRSTRYVDENGSEWITHPLICNYMDDNPLENYPLMLPIISVCWQECGIVYKKIVNILERYMINKGVDKFNARKQARGAARGYLGNALQTEMIFTAPVSGWLDMVRQRCSQFADAEIRLLYNQVLPELKRSRYGHFFDKMSLVDSPDGIGKVLKEDL